MSDPLRRQRDPTPDRDPAVTAFLIFFAVVLLLPGVCAVMFSPILFAGGSDAFSSGLRLIWVVGALTGLGGIAVVIFVVSLFTTRR